MYLVLSCLFGFLSVTLAMLGVLMISDARRLEERMRSALITPGPVDTALVDRYADHRARTFLSRLIQPLVNVVKPLIPEEWRRQARVKLMSAGMLRYLGETEFILLRGLFFALGLAMAVYAYQFLAPRNILHALISGISALAVGALLPDYWLQACVNQRQNTIRKMLPDAIDLLVVSVEAGTGFDAAMGYVEERFGGPIAEEFGRALQEMRLGKPRAMALRDMANRTAVEEVSIFVAAVCQADQLGVSMAQVLRVQAEALRQKRLYRIREMAQKLPVKMLFPLVFLIFPALFVVILGPGAISIYENVIQR